MEFKRCKEKGEASRGLLTNGPYSQLEARSTFPPANRERDSGRGGGGASRGLRLDSILSGHSAGGGGGSASAAGSGSGEEGRPEATVASHP